MKRPPGCKHIIWANRPGINGYGDALNRLSYYYRQYENKFWRADIYEMVNHQTGKKTILEFEDWTFSNNLTPKDFNKKSLKNIR